MGETQGWPHGRGVAKASWCGTGGSQSWHEQSSGDGGVTACHDNKHRHFEMISLWMDK